MLSIAEIVLLLVVDDVIGVDDDNVSSSWDS